MTNARHYTRRILSRGKTVREAWVFCDESGHSGINYNDAQDPFLVLGGFIVTGGARARAEAVVTSFVDELQIPTEPKFRDVWRKSRQARTLSMLRSLGQAGALPVFYFMQKKYAVAGKIVDVLLDPMHNPAARWLPTTELRARIEITNLIYTVNDELLRDFATAYKDPSENVDLLGSCLVRLVRFAQSQDAPRLVAGFQGAIEHLNDIIDAEDYESLGAGRHADHASLNVPALTNFMRQCDMILDMYRPKCGTLIHDEQSQFEPVFRHYVRMVQALGVGHRELEDVLDRNDMACDRVGVRNIHRFSMHRSNDEPLLLAADILAGGVARLLKLVLDEKPWSEAERELAALTLPAVIGNRQAVSAYYADEHLVVAALGRLVNRDTSIHPES